MAVTSDSDFLGAVNQDPETLADARMTETRASYEKIETLFAKVRLPAELTTAIQEEPDETLELAGFDDTRLLGAGSFGAVYVAFDQRLRRRVAIKVPRAVPWCVEDQRDRYLREARLAAQLNHPGIVTLLELIEDKDQCYLVSEFVEGGTLESLLEKDSVTHGRSAEIATRLADALAHAHQRNVVHRDLKPTNVLIDQAGNPRITDFGLAIQDDDQESSFGYTAGTLEYMAPEQLPGQHQYIDGRADIWSLGVVFYRMLTRRLPFAGADREELFQQIRTRAPKPPRQIDPTIPARLEEICLRCLEKDASDRYSSAGEIASDLRRFPNTNSLMRMRRLLIAFVVLAIVALGGLAIQSNRKSVDNTIPSGAPSESTQMTDIRVLSMRLRHFRYDQTGRGTDLGSIGLSSHTVQLNDEIRIEFEFSKPASFYLLEFTSRGNMQLHYSSTDQGSREQHQRFQFPTQPDANLCLDDGIGMHAFVVVASDTELPQFEQWRAQVGEPPWQTARHEGIWRFVDDDFDNGYFLRHRGSIRRREQAPKEFRELCRYLSEQPGIAVHAMGFPVQPGPQAPRDQ